MLIELVITLSIIVTALGISYPSVVAIMDNIDEQIAVTKIVQHHNKAMVLASKSDKPIQHNGVSYYPNLTLKPTTLLTRKHKMVFGKYNTLRVERLK